MEGQEDRPDWLIGVDDAWEAGDLARASRLCRAAAGRFPNDPEPMLRLAFILEEADEGDEAVKAAAAAVRIAPRDPLCLAEHAWLLFDAAFFDGARAQAEAALLACAERSGPGGEADVWPEALAHNVLGWLADREGRSDEAAKHDRAAAGLCPEDFPVPIDVPRVFADSVVSRVISELPLRYRSLIEETPVAVQPHPHAELLADGDLRASVLGAYSGTSLLDRSATAPTIEPSCIYVFTRCLARSCRRLDDAGEELRITLLHEFAHHLGFDEVEMSGLGLD